MQCNSSPLVCATTHRTLTNPDVKDISPFEACLVARYFVATGDTRDRIADVWNITTNRFSDLCQKWVPRWGVVATYYDRLLLSKELIEGSQLLRFKELYPMKLVDSMDGRTAPTQCPRGTGPIHIIASFCILTLYIYRRRHHRLLLLLCCCYDVIIVVVGCCCCVAAMTSSSSSSSSVVVVVLLL